MNKHTAGPWELKETTYDTVISDWSVIAGGDFIRLFPYKRIYSDDKSQSGLVICRERMANAHLIAAAPDLLEALKLLHEVAGSIKADSRMLKNYPNLLGAVRVADKAIAKATGEQQ